MLPLPKFEDGLLTFLLIPPPREGEYPKKGCLALGISFLGIEKETKWNPLMPAGELEAPALSADPQIRSSHPRRCERSVDGTCVPATRSSCTLWISAFLLFLVGSLVEWAIKRGFVFCFQGLWAIRFMMSAENGKHILICFTIYIYIHIYIYTHVFRNVESPLLCDVPRRDRAPPV